MDGISIDITERKQAEEALRESKELEKALLNAPTESAILIDTEGTVLAINNIAAQRLGKNIDEIIGSRIFDALPPDLAKERKKQGDEVIQSGKSIRFEDERDGKYFSNSIYPVLDTNGKVTRLAIYARDITEGKLAEAELEKHREHLEELVKERTTELAAAKETAESANRSKSEFLANMSHELRTPLNSILGYAQILKNEKKLTEKQNDGLDIIYRSGEHLLTLINDILDLSKIEARKMEIALSDFNLPEMLKNIKQVFRIQTETKGISFNFEVLSDLPHSAAAELALDLIQTNVPDDALPGSHADDSRPTTRAP